MHRRWAAAVRAKPRSVQAAIFSAVAAVVAGLIAVVLVVAAPGDEPLASAPSQLPERPVQSQPSRVAPPRESKPRPVGQGNPSASRAAREQGASIADLQGPDQAGADEGSRPQTLVEDEEEAYGVGGRSPSSEETFDGIGEFVPAPANEARAAIRAYIGASPLEQLPMSFTYLVQPDETMAGIAQRFGLHIGSVRVNNMHIDNPAQMQVGTELELPVRDGLLYKVQSGDTLEDLLFRYEADRGATIAYEPNRLTPDPNAIYIDQPLLLVGGTRPGLGGAYYAPLTVWYMPVEYERITDPFGTPRNNPYGMHTGVDFAAPSGAPVRAARAGTVSNGGWDDSYGRWIEIDHGGETKSRYAHLSGSRVVIGQHVAAGEVIGWIGSTGQSTGPHLHFEILRHNQPINPHPHLGLS